MGELSGRRIGALSVRSGFLIPRPSHPPTPSSLFAMRRPGDALGGALRDAGNSRGRLAFGVFRFPPWVYSLSFPLPHLPMLDSRSPLYSTVPHLICEKTAACIVTHPERSHVFQCHSVPHHRDYSDRTASHWPPGSPIPWSLIPSLHRHLPHPPPPPLSFFCTGQIASPPPRSRPAIVDCSRPGSNSHPRGSPSKLCKVNPRSTHQHFPSRPCSVRLIHSLTASGTQFVGG